MTIIYVFINFYIYVHLQNIMNKWVKLMNYFLFIFLTFVFL